MIIDLTVTLNVDTPVYPGDPKTIIEPAGIFEKDGFNDHLVSFGTHVGTHIDAPIHVINGGKTLDQYDASYFVGRGRYIDVREGFKLEKVKDAGINEGDIVLFHTGLAEKYREESYFTDFPVVPDEIADYLVEVNPNIVGMDMGSPDHEPFPVHKKLLTAEILIIENLTNLEKLEGREFIIYALPIKLDIDAAPARVIAVTTP